MPAAKAATASRDLTAELAFLTRALKAPTLRESVSRLVSAYDLTCRLVYDLTCRSRRIDHCRLSPPETTVRRSLSR